MARKSRQTRQQNLLAPSKFTHEEPEIQYQTALYGRLSLQNLGIGRTETMEYQIEILREYVAKHPELKVVDVYTDNGCSGSTFNRPEFNRMMEDVKKGRINCIVIRDFSRFGRNYLETGYYLQQVFPAYQVRFISIFDEFDSAVSDLDAMVFSMKHIVNDFYSKDISRKISSAYDAIIRSGHVWGKPPFGYRRRPDSTGRLLMDEETAPTLFLIFQWAKEGINSHQIARRLNALEIPSNRLIKANRIPDQEKDESESISNQRALILKYLKEHPEFDNWTIQEFVDDGYTGTNGNRPQFQRMVDLVQQRAIQCVIVKDLSRFARNYILLGEYMEQIFPYLGVRFIAINDGYDSQKTTSATDNMSVVLKSVLNAYYSKELSHKIRATIYLKMQRKERLGMAPFGYVLDESRTQYLIDPEAAQTVRLIFQLAIQKKGTTEIADYLNANHIPTIAEYYRERPELGKSHFPLAEHPQWDSTKVWHLLRDKAYMGTLILRKSTVIVPASKKTRQTDETEQIVFENAHEPIVSKEEFELAQEIFPASKPRAPRNTPDYPLKSMVFCGTCRYRMVRTRVMGKDGAKFYCHHSVQKHSSCSRKRYPERDLEQTVLQSLLPMLKLTQDTLGRKRSRQDQTQTLLGECHKEISQEEAREKKIRLEKLELYEAYTSGTVSLRAYRAQKEVLTREGKAVSSRLSQLREQKSALEGGILPSEMMKLTEGARQYQYATALSRDMVTAFVDAILVYEDHVEIQWKFQDIWAALEHPQAEFKNEEVTSLGTEEAENKENP